MSKNKKNASSKQQPTRNYVANTPSVVSMDVLGILSEEDLLARGRSLEDERQKFVDQHDVRAWEEEIAYVRRELQIRKTRRDLHELYLSQHKDTLYSESECDVIQGDFNGDLN